MMQWLLTDPRVFNYLIVVLYGLNSARWLIHGNWADGGYWAGALLITSCVTWGYKH